MSAISAATYPCPGHPDQFLGQAMLILDDCEFDRLKLRRLIRDANMPFDLVEVDSLDAMESALEERDFDLVLIDYYLVGGTGFEALSTLDRCARKAPVSIMITGDEQTEIAVQAIKRGCADYLPKSRLSADRLKSAILDAQGGLVQGGVPEGSHLRAVEEKTSRLVSRSSTAVRPELAQILSELRKINSRLAKSHGAAAQGEGEFEDRCGELWGKLRDPETYRETQH